MSSYPEIISPSEEVENYENDFGWIMETDWRSRAHERFRKYRQDRSDTNRHLTLSVLALAMTKEETLREITELDLLYELPSVPHPLGETS